jgi:hypothetical protein
VVVDALRELLDHLYEDAFASFLDASPEEREGHLFGPLLIVYAWLHATGRTRPDAE